MNAFSLRVSRCLLATLWLFGALQLSESKIVCQAEPEDPKIVVFGVNSSTVRLIWQSCIGDAGEIFNSFVFKRQKPDDVTPQQIASRGASDGGFTMSDPFKDFKKYRAFREQELRIFNVQVNDEYVYTLWINYRTSGGVYKDLIFQVTVLVKVPPEITTAPRREIQLSLNSATQNYTLRCNASGDPHPSISWTKDGIPASQFNASGYLLHLVDVQKTDAGSYRCTASNGYGTDATSIGIVNIRCTDCTTERVGITIRNVDYKQPLSNEASIEFKNLESKLLSTIWGAYADNPGKKLHRVDVNEFRSGSVYAVVELAFGPSVSDPLKPLRDEMNDGKLGSFTVDRQLDVSPTIGPITLSTSRTTESAEIGPETGFRFTSTDSTSMADASWRKQRQILHAIYSTVICLLVVVIIVLVILLWTRRYNKGPGNTTGFQYHSQYNQNDQITDQVTVAYTNTSHNLILRDEASATSQSRRPGDSLSGENQVNSDQEYMSLNPATKLRNWEISREYVQVSKVIGKGTFSQVAKALAWNINGIKGLTTVAVKMLKGNATDVDYSNPSGPDHFLKVADSHYSDMSSFSGNGLREIP